MATETTTSPTDTAAARDVRATVEKATQTAHEAIDRVAAKAIPALEQLQSSATEAKQNLQDKAIALGEMEEEWLNTARGYVREHPLGSVLVALAAGVLISRLAS